MAQLQTLVKALDILTLLGQSDHPMSVEELAVALGLPKSTVYRLIQTLEAKDFARRYSRSEIDLGYHFINLGRSAYGRIEQGLLRSARPLLQSMAAQPGADGVHSLLGLSAAIPILLGDNIGTTVTAVLAAIGQGRDAKRVAAAHAIFNLSGAAVCCALLQPFAALVRLCSPTGAECAVIARQIANAHTLFNGLCALVWLPLTGQMVRLVCTLLPDKNRPKERL